MIKRIFKHKLIRNIGFYTILNLLNSAIPFLLLPVLTNYLSKEEYGVIDIFNNMSNILAPIVGLNIGAAIIRFYYDEAIDFSRFVFNAVLFLCFSGMVFVIITFILTNFLTLLPNLNGNLNYIIVFSILYSLFSQICEILLSVWRAKQKPLFFGVFRICKTCTDLGISVYLITYLSFSWEGRVYTATAISILFAIISIIILRKINFFEIKFDWIYIKQGVVYSAPLIIHSVSGYIISFSDRFIIMKFAGLKEVGVYAVAYQIGMVMSFISNSFNQAWTPFLFSKLAANEILTLKRIHKINYIYFGVMVLIAMLMYSFVPIIYKLFIGKSFVVSHQVVLWVLLGYALNGMYKMIVNYLFYFKKTRTLAQITFLCALINVILSWYFVKWYGIIGASFATFVSFLLMFIFVYIEYQKEYKKLSNPRS